MVRICCLAGIVLFMFVEDADLVTSIIDEEVIFYENKVDARNLKTYLIRLAAKETKSFNQKNPIYTFGQVQFQELTPYRGFQSSVALYTHFGFGNHTTIDSIIIEWPDWNEKGVGCLVGNNNDFSKIEGRFNFEL